KTIARSVVEACGYSICGFFIQEPFELCLYAPGCVRYHDEIKGCEHCGALWQASSPTCREVVPTVDYCHEAAVCPSGFTCWRPIPGDLAPYCPDLRAPTD